jgi:K+-sensing histidine kinase KdpD
LIATDQPRTEIRASADAQSAHRAGSRAGALLERFNRPITVVTAISILIFDRFVAPSMAMGAAYVTVVLLSLWAPRTRDTYLAALLCTAFVVFDTAMTEPSVAMWLYVSNRMLAVAVIWMTAIMCLWRKRQQEADARVLSQAERALLESREVLQALDRAEKPKKRIAWPRRGSLARSAAPATVRGNSKSRRASTGWRRSGAQCSATRSGTSRIPRPRPCGS